MPRRDFDPRISVFNNEKPCQQDHTDDIDSTTKHRWEDSRDKNQVKHNRPGTHHAIYYGIKAFKAATIAWEEFYLTW